MKKVIGLIACLAAGSANAGIIDIYTGVGAGELRADWEAAVGSFSEEDFAGGVLEDFSITSTATVFDIVGDLTDRVSPSDSTVITFDDAITSFGANWDLTPGGAGLGIQINAGGTLLAIEIPDTFSGEFFGFTSDVAFTSITLTAGTQGGVAETYDADNFVYSSASVSEPAALALLGLGLVGIGLSRKNKIA